MLELNKQKGLINIKLTFTFHMCMEHGMVLPEEMDDFKTNFDSTYTVITTTLQLLLLTQQLPRRLAQSNKMEPLHLKP